MAAIGILTVAFNEESLIGACIKQWQAYDFKHLVLVSSKPWHGPQLKPDKTEQVASSLGAEVVTGDWSSEAEQRNFGLDYFKDYDWVLIVDADEFYTEHELLIDSLNTEAQSVVANNMQVYWKTPEYLIQPDQLDRPIVAIRPALRFTKARNADATKVDTAAVLYHLSYVRTDEEMLKKIMSFEHFNEFDVIGWYNDIWLKWTKDTTDFHPVNPPQFHSVIDQPIPETIRQLL